MSKNVGQASKTKGAGMTYVEVPTLTVTHLRKMMYYSGRTYADFSRFLGKSRNYVHMAIMGGRVSLTLCEALYLYLGHDMFWTLYTKCTKNTPTIRHVPLQPQPAPVQKP